jgi:chromosome segregation ATPase
LKLLVEKNQKQDLIISELKEALKVAYDEYKIIQKTLQEKEDSKTNEKHKLTEEVQKARQALLRNESEMGRLQEEISQMFDINNDLKKNIQRGNREVADLKLEIEGKEEIITSLDLKLSKIKEKHIGEMEGLEEQLRDLQNQLKVKVVILDNKAREVDDIKQKEQSQIKESLTHKSELETKLKNANETIKELENQIKRLKEKNSEKIAMLNEFEIELERQTERITELEELTNFNEKENSKEKLSELEEKLKISKDREKEKEARMDELLELIDDLKKSLLDRKRTIEGYKKESLEKLNYYKNIIDEKQKEIEELKKLFKEAENDTKVLVVELERKKMEARETMNKFEKIFN